MSELVRFKNGRYGIRRRSALLLWLGYEYWSGNYWWRTAEHVAQYCMLTEKQVAAYKAGPNAGDWGEPVPHPRPSLADEGEKV